MTTPPPPDAPEPPKPPDDIPHIVPPEPADPFGAPRAADPIVPPVFGEPSQASTPIDPTEPRPGGVPGQPGFPGQSGFPEITSPPGTGPGDIPPGMSGGYPPPMPPYGATPSPPPGDNKGNIYGILALSLGIASVVLSWCCGLGILAGIPAVVLGIIGMRKADAGEANNKNLALIGLILGAVGFVISCVACGISGPGAWDDFQRQIDDY